MGQLREMQREQGPFHAEEVGCYSTEDGEALKGLSRKLALSVRRVCVCVYILYGNQSVHVEGKG